MNLDLFNHFEREARAWIDDYGRVREMRCRPETWLALLAQMEYVAKVCPVGHIQRQDVQLIIDFDGLIPEGMFVFS